MAGDVSAENHDITDAARSAADESRIVTFQNNMTRLYSQHIHACLLACICDAVIVCDDGILVNDNCRAFCITLFYIDYRHSGLLGSCQKVRVGELCIMNEKPVGACRIERNIVRIVAAERIKNCCFGHENRRVIMAAETTHLYVCMGSYRCMHVNSGLHKDNFAALRTQPVCQFARSISRHVFG